MSTKVLVNRCNFLNDPKLAYIRAKLDGKSYMNLRVETEDMGAECCGARFHILVSTMRPMTTSIELMNMVIGLLSDPSV